jgi:hypothetical protein
MIRLAIVAALVALGLFACVAVGQSPVAPPPTCGLAICPYVPEPAPSQGYTGPAGNKTIIDVSMIPPVKIGSVTSRLGRAMGGVKFKVSGNAKAVKIIWHLFLQTLRTKGRIGWEGENHGEIKRPGPGFTYFRFVEALCSSPRMSYWRVSGTFTLIAPGIGAGGRVGSHTGSAESSWTPLPKC